MTLDESWNKFVAGLMAGNRYLSKEPYRRDVKLWRDAEMLSETNTLERPFIWSLEPKPKNIELMGKLLLWRPDEKRERTSSSQQSDVGLLNKFIRLDKASPEEILRFAQQWGVLGLCKHFVPYTHFLYDIDKDQVVRCKLLEFDTGQHWEPVERWRYFARRARAILRVASRLNQNKQGYFKDWQVLNPTLSRPLNKLGGMYLLEKTTLAEKIEYWLDYGNVRPQFTWPGDKPLISFGCNVLGLITCHIMFAVSRSGGIAICRGCGYPYSPIKRPKTNQRNYCKSCGKKASSRDSQADRRKRLKRKNAGR